MVVDLPTAVQLYQGDLSRPDNDLRPFTKIALSHLAEFSGFTRYVASNLPYGKGGRILLRFLRRRLTFNYFQFNQRYTRKVGLVNQYSLMLEVWK